MSLLYQGKLQVAKEHAGKRLDVLLTKLLQETLAVSHPQLAKLSRSRVEAIIEEGSVHLAGKPLRKPGHRLCGGEELKISIFEAPAISVSADAEVQLDIVYEDASVLVINKAAGIVVHPGAGNFSKTLAHGLVHYLGEKSKLIGEAFRPGLVHRLDKGTSGLMVVAKTEAAQQSLVKQFSSHEIGREYLALVSKLPVVPGGGRKNAESGLIALPIGRHPKERKKMSVNVPHGRSACTEWCIEERLRYGYLLRLKLQSGRTHQIRVHLHACGASIVGDPTYGRGNPSEFPAELRKAIKDFGRQALHATTLYFRHPEDNKEVSFTVPPPVEMLKLLALARRADE